MKWKKVGFAILVLIMSIPVIFLLDLFLISAYSCNAYQAYVDNEIKKVDKTCSNDNDCVLRIQYGCRTFCVNRNYNLDEFSFKLNEKFKSTRGLFFGCPMYSCKEPDEKCICENKICELR